LCVYVNTFATREDGGHRLDLDLTATACAQRPIPCRPAPRRTTSSPRTMRTSLPPTSCCGRSRTARSQCGSTSASWHRVPCRSPSRSTRCATEIGRSEHPRARLLKPRSAHHPALFQVPLCEVESCNHVEGARLRVNLANRERPKWFTFSSAAEAAAFCAVTRRCLDHAAPPHASPRSDKKRAGRGVLGGLRALLREKTTPQDDMLLARTFAFSDESTGGGGSAAARSAASARSRSAAEAAQGPGGFEGCAAPRRRPRPLGRVSKRRPTPVLPPLWQVRRKAPARARSLRRPPPSPLRRLLALGRGVKSTRSTDRTWRLLASGSRPAPSP